jgi:hypothetical protein
MRPGGPGNRRLPCLWAAGDRRSDQRKAAYGSGGLARHRHLLLVVRRGGEPDVVDQLATSAGRAGCWKATLLAPACSSVDSRNATWGASRHCSRNGETDASSAPHARVLLGVDWNADKTR